MVIKIGGVTEGVFKYTNEDTYYYSGYADNNTSVRVTKPYMPLVVKVEHGDLIPQKGTNGSAGFDLRSKEDVVLKPNKRTLVGTGVRAIIPEDHVGLLFPRSSLSKNSIVMTNSVGVIDSDYRGEILASLMYMGEFENGVIIPKNERIVQLVVMPVPYTTIKVDNYSTEEQWNNTARGTGGFGSTGKQ